MDFSMFDPLAVAGGIMGVAIVVSLLVIGLRRRRAGQADRLSSAFDRARYARRTGTMGSDRGYIR